MIVRMIKMGSDWQHFEIEVPKGLSEKEKLALGEDVIEYMRKRTESGKNNSGGSFPKYSKEYMKSLDFKIAGKTSKVNLTQTGDMLADIEVLDIKKDKIVIGFEKGSLSNDKADGHITGWQGRSDIKRPFLGFVGEGEKGKLKSIIRKHEAPIEKDSLALKALAWLSKRDLKSGKK
jgi:hypothetical protein